MTTYKEPQKLKSLQRRAARFGMILTFTERKGLQLYRRVFTDDIRVTPAAVKRALHLARQEQRVKLGLLEFISRHTRTERKD